MAYRMLRLVTLVAVGALAVGCGSGSGPDVSRPPLDEDPPASADDPPINYDAPPGSADDAPPGNADTPGAATPPDDDDDDAEGLCHQLCDGVNPSTCTSEVVGQVLSEICRSNCQASAAEKACESKFVDALSCFIDIDDLCTREPETQRLSTCQGKLGDAVQCSKSGSPSAECSMADQCARCANSCEVCRCVAGAQAAATCAAVCM